MMFPVCFRFPVTIALVPRHTSTASSPSLPDMYVCNDVSYTFLFSTFLASFFLLSSPLHLPPSAVTRITPLSHTFTLCLPSIGAAVGAAAGAGKGPESQGCLRCAHLPHNTCQPCLLHLPLHPTQVLGQHCSVQVRRRTRLGWLGLGRVR